MPRLVIVEGPDGAGKSTLAEKLSYDLSIPFVHTGGAAKDLAELMARMEKVQETPGPAIIDRCPHISDAIYKRAMGQPLFMNPLVAWKDLMTVGPMIIYCRLQDPAEMLTAIVETKKDHKPPEYLERVRQEYPEILHGYDFTMDRLKRMGLWVFDYDWKRSSYDRIKEAVSVCAV